MKTALQTQSKPQKTNSVATVQAGLLQRKCACGGSPGVAGECAGCSEKRLSGLQTKLAVSQPGDEYEHEADRMADQVMRMSVPSLAAVGSGYAATRSIQRKPQGESTEWAGEPLVNNVISSPGQPLDPTTRAFFEPRFGHGFGRVRVHADDRAAESARAVHARAYTVGEHVVFAAKQFSPASTDGRRLLAHELTHVIQQGAADGTRVPEEESETGDSTRPKDGMTSADETVGDVSRLATPKLSAGLKLQRAACPCCADSISITNINRIDDATKMGHSFDTHMGLSYPATGPSGSCTLEWWEKTNVPAITGHVADTWTDMFQLMGGASFGTWTNRLENCGTSTLVVDTDPPTLAKTPGRTVTRTLEFRIVTNSMPPTSDGGCAAASQQVTATQVLKMVNGVPDWAASSFTTP